MTDHAAKTLEPASSWALHLPSDLEHRALEFLNDGGEADPYERFTALLARFAWRLGQPGPGREALLSLLADPDDEAWARERTVSVEAIRASFTKTQAEADLRSYCRNLSNGCEGGSWSSGFWCCGLEWGGGWTDPKTGKPYVNLDNFEYPESAESEDEEKIADWLDAYPFNQRLARFMCRFFGWTPQAQNPEHGDFAREAAKHNAFLSSEEKGMGAKLNLYPLSRRSHNDWEALSVRWRGADLGTIASLDGIFPSQARYQEMAAEERSRGFQTKLQENARAGRPTVVIGIGIGNRSQFARAFGADESALERIEVENANVQAFPILDPAAKAGRTHLSHSWLVVIPFFYGGPAALGSYEKLDAVAQAIRTFLAAKGVQATPEGLRPAEAVDERAQG